MKRRSWAVVLLVLGISGSAAGVGEDEAIRLTLEECLVLAIRNNLGVAVALRAPEIAASGLALAKERFMPALSFGLGFTRDILPSSSWFDGTDRLDQDSRVISAGVRQTLTTGGDLALEFSTAKSNTNERALTVNPSYRSLLRLSFRQPLLKDSGSRAARYEIIVAGQGLDIGRQEAWESLQDTVYAAEVAYWDLVFARDDLKIKQESLRLAQDLQERNRKAVEAETMAPVNILNARVQVAAREADVLRAEAGVGNAEDQLKRVINLAAEHKASDSLRIIPQGTPAAAEREEITLDEALAVALRNRPDIEALRIGIRTGEARVGYARNQTRPDLSLAGSLSSPGLSGTSLIYAADDPFGEPISRLPGGRWGSLKEAFGFKYATLSFGITLDLPVGEVTSRAAYAQARIELEKRTLELRNLEQEVLTRVKIALRDTVTNRRRIQALKTARELAEEQLGAEEEKLKAGYSTTYFVLQYQSELSIQRSHELEAMIEYRQSLARLKRELGTNLAEHNIRIDRLPTE
jgi:outer membrane protein TolC